MLPPDARDSWNIEVPLSLPLITSSAPFCFQARLWAGARTLVDMLSGRYLWQALKSRRSLKPGPAAAERAAAPEKPAAEPAAEGARGESGEREGEVAGELVEDSASCAGGSSAEDASGDEASWAAALAAGGKSKSGRGRASCGAKTRDEAPPVGGLRVSGGPSRRTVHV